MKKSAVFYPVQLPAPKHWQAVFPQSYEQKTIYRKYLRLGFGYAVLLHIVLLSAYLVINYWIKQSADEQLGTQQRIINVTLTDIQPPPSLSEEEQPPPPKIEEIISPPPKDLSALTPEPVAKENADLQTTKTQQELEKIKTPVSMVGDTAGVLSFSGPVKIEEKKIEQKIEREEKKIIVKEEKTVFQTFEVEKPPEAVNLAQVRSSMTYPEVARQAGIEGKVTVKVLVGMDGSAIKTGTLTGPEVFYDEVRSKSMLLQFTPGLQNGKPVKVWVTVPFNFKLKD